MEIKLGKPTLGDWTLVEVKEGNTTLNFSVSGEELIDFRDHLLDTGIELCEIEDLVNYLRSRDLLRDILYYIEFIEEE